MNIIVEIQEATDRYDIRQPPFDLRLEFSGGLNSSEGRWTCLPGYLAMTQGYFHRWGESALVLDDREEGTLERLGRFFSGAANPVVNLVTLWSFGKWYDLRQGMRGTGIIGMLGSFQCNWKIKESPVGVLENKLMPHSAAGR